MRRRSRRRGPGKSRLGCCLFFLLALIGGLYLLLQSNWLLRQIYPIKYETLIVEKAQAYNLDPYLILAMAKVESGFNPEAISTKDARGLMQLMPETAQWIADRRNLSYSKELLFDPEYNIDFGCWYFASLLQEFSGDILQSLAAYNAGRGNVHRWLKEGIWSGGGETVSQIPFPETRRYLERVQGMAQIYRRLYAELGGR